ncbi:Na+/H+ antiporter subunit E [Streptomyces sp. NPDC051561]|uniref:Na+/H+ antiporter subunit E n=1 Tax=Streptomyces sp. NPDC051561 TaxID=3365658 RepID=UPI0037927F2C
MTAPVPPPLPTPPDAGLPSTPRSLLRRLDAPLIGWLAVIWMLLWSGPSWGNLFSGVLVAVVLCLVFPLPPVELGLRLRPLSILRLAKYLLIDMTLAGHAVVLLAWSGRPQPAAVVRVPLRCRTDLMLAATAVAVSSVPGGALVEVNAATATMYLHVTGADDPRTVARTRQDVWRLERLVVKAFGTLEECDRVRREPPPVEPPPPSPATGKAPRP